MSRILFTLLAFVYVLGYAWVRTDRVRAGIPENAFYDPTPTQAFLVRLYCPLFYIEHLWTRQ